MIQTSRLSPAIASRLLCVGRRSAPADALAIGLDPAVPSIPGRGFPTFRQLSRPTRPPVPTGSLEAIAAPPPA